MIHQMHRNLMSSGLSTVVLLATNKPIYNDDYNDNEVHSRYVIHIYIG